MFLFIVKYTNDIEFTLEKINMLEMPSYFLFGVSKIFQLYIEENLKK
jgi:hydroxypyruvate isomerase